MRMSWIAVVLAAVLGVAAIRSDAARPDDVLPFGSVMVGVASHSFSTESGANTTTGTVALAASATFYPGTRVATIALFAQLRHTTGSGAQPSAMDQRYRTCYNEPFSITTDDVGSTLRFEAAHDPFSCLARFLLDLVPEAAQSALLPVNLTAKVHPFEPGHLVELQLYDAWAIDLKPAMAFAELLNQATTGPVTLMDDVAVAFCSAPGAFSGGFTLRVLFVGAYNVALHADAVKRDADGSSLRVCSGAAVGAATTPVAFRMAGGRLDVVGGRTLEDVDGRTVVTDASSSGDALNATARCVSAGSRNATAAAFLFAAGDGLAVVHHARVVHLRPDSCWQTAAFARVDDVSLLQGRTYAGEYAGMIRLRITVANVAMTGNGTAVFSLTGTVSNGEFTATCGADAGAATVVLSRSENLAVFSDQTTCLGQALQAVANAPWLRLEYVNGADAFWFAVPLGAFLATRV